jgi:hypothetical protein
MSDVCWCLEGVTYMQPETAWDIQSAWHSCVSNMLQSEILRALYLPQFPNVPLGIHAVLYNPRIFNPG